MVKFVFRWAFRLVLLLLVLFVGLLLLKDTLAKSLLTARVQSVTGLETRIGRLEIGLFTPTITVEDFRLFNAAEFGGSTFVHVRELHVEYDPAALRAREVRLALVRFDLAEVGVVEDKTGRQNFQVLQQRAEARRRDSRLGDPTDLRFGGIDMLNLSLGKLRFVYLSDPKKNFEVDFGVRNEIIHNVRSKSDLTRPLVREILRRGINLFGVPGTGTNPPVRSAPAPPQPPPPRVTPPASPATRP